MKAISETYADKLAEGMTGVSCNVELAASRAGEWVRPRGGVPSGPKEKPR
jgi:hypothetical protein